MFCSGCQRQTSPTAGTILHNSRTSLRKWFLAAWLVCTQKTEVSAKTLQRELKVGYKTAWLMLQKLRQATVRAERSQLSGVVEVDETYVAGAESGVGGRQLVGNLAEVASPTASGAKQVQTGKEIVRCDGKETINGREYWKILRDDGGLSKSRTRQGR